MKVQLERLSTVEFVRMGGVALYVPLWSLFTPINNPQPFLPFKAAQRRNIVLIIWAVILLAVPLWWHTTTVYRAPLPFSDIREWSSPDVFRLNLGIHIRLHLIDRSDNGVKGGTHTAEAVNGTAKDVANELNRAFSTSASQVVGARRVSQSFSVVGTVESVVWTSDTNPSDLGDKLVQGHGENGIYDIYVDCSIPDTSVMHESVHVIKRRGILVRLANACSREHITDRISAVVAGLFGDEQRSLSRLQSDPGQQDTDHASMRILKYAPEYQVVLSLLVGNPEDAIVTWDIKEAIDRYIYPFLAAFPNISNFVLSSQILNYASLPITPETRLMKNSPDHAHFLNPKAMTNFINSAEWNLASVVSSTPPINLIVYVPSTQHSPLYLLHSNGTFVHNNAFLVPQWGGITVQNPPKKAKRVHYSLAELHPIMEIFVAQLRGLLGIEHVRISRAEDLLPGVDITYEDAPELGLTDWEMDRLARARTVQNMVSSVQTLTSLANLLERLENMVVLDHIQALVIRSLESLNLAKQEIQNKQFTRASLHARDAIVSAESAFFDPTMVPLLYFPEEHKFAVYMPYFVPVSVPLIMALVNEIRAGISAWRGAKNKVKTE